MLFWQQPFETNQAAALPLKIEMFAMIPHTPPELPTPEEPPEEVPQEVEEPPVTEPEPIVEEKPPPEPLPKKTPVPRKKPVKPKSRSPAQVAVVKPAEQLPVAALSDGMIEQLRNAYKQALLAKIEESKFYPRRARKRRQEGQVKVSFVISRDGAVSEIRLQGSSGIKTLDKAAVEVLQSIRRFRPIPEALGANTLEFVVPLEYRLLKSG